MLASIAVWETTMVGRGGPNSYDSGISGHVQHARARFPAEQRFHLTSILLRPEVFTLANRPGANVNRLVSYDGVRGGPGGDSQTRRSLRDLEQLTTDGDVGAEALAHLGWLRFHLNQLPQSTLDLKAAAQLARDPFVRNLAWLGAGLALDAQGARNDATAAYRQAVQSMPAAKASATALAVHLLEAGKRLEASTVLTAAYSASPAALDPWKYTVADYRFLPGYIAQLRTAVGHPQAIRPLAAGELNVGLGQAEDAAPTRASAVSAEATSEQPTFRSDATGVAVDVSVVADKLPVAGLSNADFRLMDNGVPQTIKSVSVEDLSLDVSLVVDLNDRALAVRGSQLADPVEEYKAEALRTVELLRPTDRVRLFVVESQPIELVPLASPRGTLPVQLFDSLRSNWGKVALYDAMAAALLRSTQEDRRAVVVVLSDGADQGSVLRGEQLLAAARISEPIIFFARSPTFREFMSQGGVFSPPRELWPPDPLLTERIVKEAGGVLVNRPGPVTEQLRRLLEGYRRRYVLRYQPAGVPAAGWHEVVVTVARPGSYEVRARKGYFGG